MTFFCTWRAAFRKWFFGFPAVFHSVHVEPIFPSSGSFPWILNVWRRLLVSIDSRVVEFERHPHPTMLAIHCLQLFRWFSTFFVSHVKITTFEFFKPLKALWFTKSMLTVSFDKHSMRFCNSFLQMTITENQCCPQIVVSRHKIRHVQRYYKLYCCMKFVLLWVENLCQMSEQGNGVNGAVWQQLHWQLWPSIGKFRFHTWFNPVYIPGIINMCFLINCITSNLMVIFLRCKELNFDFCNCWGWYQSVLKRIIFYNFWIKI